MHDMCSDSYCTDFEVLMMLDQGKVMKVKHLMAVVVYCSTLKTDEYMVVEQTDIVAKRM